MRSFDKINSKYPNGTEDEQNKYLWRFLKVQAAFGMIMAARENDVIEYESARKHFERIEGESASGEELH